MPPDDRPDFGQPMSVFLFSLRHLGLYRNDGAEKHSCDCTDPASEDLASWLVAWQRTPVTRFFSSIPFAVGLFGALGLFLGMPNPLAHLPPLALAYPAALAWFGLTAGDRGKAFRRGWLCGLAGASACLYWIAVPVTEVARQPLLLGASCATLLGSYVGVYGGLFALLAHKFRHAAPGRVALTLGLGWFLLETLRGWLCTGFPWLPLAAAFTPWTAWIQPVAWIGAYAFGGVLAGLTGLALVSFRARRFRGVLAVILVLALIPVAGLWRMNGLDMGGEEVSVALVQGNINQNQKWDGLYLNRTIQTYMALSENTGAALIVWPETAMPIDYPDHERGKDLRRFAAGANAWLLFGAPGVERRPGAEDLFNRAFLISPLGRNRGFYEKEHLVPFGEYVPPFLDLPFLQGLLQGIGDFTPGRRTAPLVLSPSEGRVDAPLALGILICYETIFPELSRQRVAEGAEVLINISNDAWFGRSSAPEQHLHLSILRAVEQQRWLVRGTNTGVSALIDPAGRVTARSGLFVAETLKGFVRPVRETTLFFHVYPWLTPLAVLLFVFLAWRLRRPSDHTTR